MTHDLTDHGKESPARRLGILYIASFCMIGLLSGVGQLFILREHSWQTGAIHAIGDFAGRRALDRPLSLAALRALAVDWPDDRGGPARTLRDAIRRSHADAAGALHPASGSEPVSALLSRQAEGRRLAASRTAETLLAVLDRAEPGAPRPAEAATLVKTILAEEDSFARALGDAARMAEMEAVARIDRLESLEIQMFALVMVVLLLEGVFVFNPAVRRIGRFTQEMSRSHAELRDYARKLEWSNKELQDFASVASHDLQEPLRKVQAFSDRLKSKYAAAFDDQGRDYLDRVQNAARRMQTLINDLLTYARVATKAQPFVATNLAAVAREVVSDLEARIEQADGRVEVGDLPEIDADPLQIRQLMQNLIGNSLKYRRPDVPPVVKVSGGATLADVPDARAGAPARPVCRIVVEDNGIGFEDIYAERIFTIFQRLHGRNEFEGTGVGLAVCRKIVERHGGTITARGTPGAGSTFNVTLPVRQPKEMDPDG